MKRKRLFTTLLACLLFVLASGCSSYYEETISTEKTVAQEYTSQGTPINTTFDKSDVSMLSTPDSTCFSQIGYESGNLVVTFRDSGASYVYYDVPSSVWKELKSASSMGGYYNSKIKGYYDCEKLG